MPVSTDPNFILLYGLDESGATAARVNAGGLGTAQNLSVVQSSGTDGIPSVNDGLGGKAVDIFVTRTGYTSALRCLRGAQATGSAHTAKPALPISAASDDFAFGVRLHWGAAFVAGGANPTKPIFSLASVAGAVFGWGIGLDVDDSAAPTSAKIRLLWAGISEVITGAGWTTSGSPPTWYILPNEWYRVAVRFFFNATGYQVKLYLYRESTGVVYTFTRTAVSTTNYSSGWNVSTDCAVHVSYQDVSSWRALRQGYVDTCWLYDAPLSDSDATDMVQDGLTVPWVPPSWRRAGHKVHVSMTREGASFPKPRPLPEGTLSCRYEPNIGCERVRALFEGWHPGRPWALRDYTLIFDTVGPFSSRKSQEAGFRTPRFGMIRRPGNLPIGTPELIRDMSPYPEGPRRRRGFKIRNAVSTESDLGSNWFAYWRTYNDQLHGLFKVGSVLYADQAGVATSIDTGWSTSRIPTSAFLDNRLIILTPGRQKTSRGSVSAVESFGAPTIPSCTAAVVAGGSLTGAYQYAATEYDPTTGDEGLAVISSVVNPAAQSVTVTLGATSSDARFTQRRIYRSTNGGTSPNLFLVTTIATATSYTDTGLADGTDPLDSVVDEDGIFLGWITGTPPDTFSMVVSHMETAFYAGEGTHPERIYPSEPNDPMRWYAGGYLVCEGPVRALASYGHRLVAFTDSTVEIFESDWIRSNGETQVQHTVLSRRVGCLGSHAVVNAEGVPFWMDRRGIWTFGGQGTPEQVSGDIEDLFPFINHGISYRVVGSYNHIRRIVGFTVPMASTVFQADNTRFDTWLVAHLERPKEWGTWLLEASFHNQFDDDNNGLQFGLVDHLGVFKQMESYEGDGAQGNETFTTEDDGGDTGSVGIESIAGSVVDVFGTPGWTVNALRGMTVILRDRSTGTLYWHMIASNTAGTFTVVGTPNAALAARDGYYIGGMDARIHFAESDLASPNNKIIRKAKMAFGDLDGGLYL